ncbi:hypothetical protein A2X44_04200 [candidate division CPR3 bacterium GWF2_35_18]|uniref:SCP domain-containing protein n=1 Tax=candidate division CPR3 bacterium GW2011_GWF2_35_18 TaxID=1618350 RepID=A0A0G0BIL3_UNCC3|nr:MAG: hypothetical protein UR67_C0007G0029 [candidate division CPR3 bacterium GW2011_GWF2_35_18]OGB62557.1 MAG: hypothetical protein A2X44_04200 [candidate division CPR3 bacterium GWF2_35_18]OGB65808.1 MAG: hypothetical protein A2250_01450 [candidate division CPR3 bacterium RIFOXYA2_FULL_35_13]OGB79275.1 MAG: hypothetical protein A2296_03860 [candidate division CPR3 bacterium RIFOXYB2_FULL_35_8]
MQRFFIPSVKNKNRPYLIRSRALAFYCTVLIIFQVGFNLIFENKSGEVVAATSITASQLFQLTNDERSKLGLPVLTYNQKLANAAYNKGTDMFADQYWAHVAPDGTTPWNFILGAGYDYHYAGENLAKDFSSASSVVKAWMNSPSHRENIVNAEFKEMGIAVVTGIFEGQETTICVQMFGTLMTPAKETINNPTPAVPDNNQISQNNTTPTNNTQNTPVIEKDTTAPVPPVITSPQNHTTLNNDKPTISGTSAEKATIKIFDAQSELGSLPTDTQNSFSYRPEKSLAEGDHLFSATATDSSGNQSDHSEIVTIVIDTFPPFIDSESIVLEPFYRFSKKAIRIEVIVLADPKQVTASMGEYSLILQSDDNSHFSGILVPPEEIFNQYNKIKIESHDQAGNKTLTEKEIPEFPSQASIQNSGAVLGMLQTNTNDFINKIIPNNHSETSRMFYSIFGLGLMGLMALNSTVMEKKKIPLQGTNTLTHAVMLGISVMGVIWGNLGLITSGLSNIR